MGKSRRARRSFGYNFNDSYWQSDAYNRTVFQALRAQAIGLALNRFRYDGLPDTCDVRYLEMQLLFKGCATIAQPAGNDRFWVTLQACQDGRYNMYGDPSHWRAIGENGTSFACDNRNAVMIWDNSYRYPVMQQIDVWCRELADVIRTKQINRMHVKTPLIIETPQEQEQQAINLYKQIAGGEPAVIATRGIESIQLKVHDMGVSYLGEELSAEERNIWSRIYLILGIDNATAKAERMVAEEIKSYKAPTEIQRLDYLECRRRAFDKFNRRFGFDVKVVQNDDTFSDTYNYQRDIARIMQDVQVTDDVAEGE